MFCENLTKHINTLCAHITIIRLSSVFTVAVGSTHMYCTGLALTAVSGHYSGQLTNNLSLVLRLGMRGAVPRLVHTPAVAVHY